MIPKSELIHGKYYFGHCRNASVARWNEHTQQFYHWRHKFGFKYIETIKHKEDEHNYDTFIPDKLYEPEMIPFEEGKMG